MRIDLGLSGEPGIHVASTFNMEAFTLCHLRNNPLDGAGNLETPYIALIRVVTGLQGYHQVVQDIHPP